MKHISQLKTFTGMALVALVLTNCAPINSTFETAATVPKGKCEVRGNFSYYRYTEKVDGDRQSETTNTNLGVGLGVGLHKNVDLKLRYELLIPAKDLRDEGAGNVHFISLAPKLCFGSKQLAAFKLPIAAYITDGADTQWALSPQILVTPARKPKFDFTLAAKMDFWLNYDDERNRQTLGFTAGAGFGKNVAKTAFRPEIGLMIEPGESGLLFTIGAAFVTQFGGKKAAEPEK